MDRHARIFVSGHRGMVGSGIVRRLQADGGLAGQGTRSQGTRRCRRAPDVSRPRRPGAEPRHRARHNDRALAEVVMEVVGLRGRIVYDCSEPDGTPRKLLDVGRLSSLGWHARTALRDGIEQTQAAAPFRS